MATALFEPELASASATRAARNALGDWTRAYPWESLRAEDYPPELIEAARLGWTENAFNEWCTAAAMGQLVSVLAAAGAPLDLLALASGFAAEEVVHVELCVRVADQLGGGVAIAYDPDQLQFPLGAELTPLQRANEVVVRLCCVGEEFSLPMLAGSMRAAAHPVTRGVLERIVRGEALHGRLGWLYLDWVAPTLSADERARLGACARDAVDHLRPVWERLRTRPTRPLSPAERAAHHAMGWMDLDAYVALADRTIEEDVFGRLRRYQIA